MIAVWHGTSAMTSIATGSHIDAIPHSGMYDGTVGVLGATEAIRSLQAAGFQPKRDIHVIMFTSEKPTRFEIGCLGSHVLSRAMESSDADLLTDVNGILLEQSRNAAGFSGMLDVVPLLDDEYAAFIEHHIEQADSFEKDGTDVGAVTAIAAPAQLKFKFSGSGVHAGALAMTLRRDALLAAAEMALEVECVALNTGSDFFVATVREMEVFPDAVNSVPREVEMGIDVRDIDQTCRSPQAHHDPIISSLATLTVAATLILLALPSLLTALETKGSIQALFVIHPHAERAASHLAFVARSHTELAQAALTALPSCAYSTFLAVVACLLYWSL